MTHNNTPKYIKRDERKHVEETLLSHLDRPDWDLTALMQDMLTGKVRVTPLLTETQEASV